MIIKAAVVQLNAGPVIEDNLRQAEHFIREAARDGATLIATPENTCWMRASLEDKLKTSFPQDEHPAVSFFADLARELKVKLLIGSLASIKIGEGKVANRSFLFGKEGQLITTYDKMHMFDVQLPNGDKYRESDSNQAGDEIVVAETERVKIGLSICYDVRFPQLYRQMARQGAQVLSIPAAFTVPTGQAHWEVLLRARAIENGAFVLAPAQAGTHEGGRATYGHSMIIGPWGQILAQIQGDGTGFASAELDLAEVDKARAAIPAIQHDRFLR